MQIQKQKRSHSFVAMLLLVSFAADFAAGRPDVRQSPFALELQPPLLQPAEESFHPSTSSGGQKTIDSYGNPIDALRPIDTPDGRKVVSAQGVQFEIPTYASGITEIRRPADDLVPPHIDAIAVGLEPSSSSSSSDPKPNSFLGTASASTAPAPIPATSLTPPLHDPSPDTTTTATSGVVEVEQAHLVPLPQQQQQEQDGEEAGSLPEYLRELQRQDPNIGGPVAWQPAEDGAPLSVIAWDLLPPHQEQEKKDQKQEQEPVIITQENQQPAKRVQGVVDPISHNIRLSLSSGSVSSADPQPQDQEQHQTQTHTQTHTQSQADGPAAHGTNAHVGSTTTPSNASGRFPNRQRGTAHYSTTRSSSTTLRPRTTSSTTTTTQAPSTTRTTPRTTTTTQAPTTSTARTTKTHTTTEDPANFYSLDRAEEYAYTLPPWLQEVTDPDLDVAVTFVVPTDNDQYNHTLPKDLEPPYEPFVDLGNIQLTPPPTGSGVTAAPPPSTTPRSTTTSTPRTTTTVRTTTTTTTTTTTRRPSTKRTTTAPIPTKHTTQTQRPEPPTAKLIQNQNQIQSADAAPSAVDRSSSSTTPSSLDIVNPFDSATIPAWLRDFDYPDVGPGVPFDPNNFGPAASSSPTNPPRPFTDLPTPASSAFPSKVTLPLPGSGTTSFPSAGSSSSSSEEPPLVLIPPADHPDSGLDTGSSSGSGSGSVPVPLPGPLTNSIMPLAARFDPQETSNSIGNGESPLPPVKVEYTKSDEGKVISTPVGAIQRKAETATPATSSSSSGTTSNTGKYTGGFGAPAGLLRPQNVSPSAGSNPDIYVAGNQHEFSSVVKANKARPTVNPGRYSGGFGAPTGVLSPQSEPRPFQAPVHQQQAQASSPSGVTAGVGGGSHRQTESSRFGGPPGILVPFDNVQRNGGQ